MNEQRIINLIDDLFCELEQTPEVMEQKEELRAHMTERIKDYMDEGLLYDDAFNAARDDLGDVDELIHSLKPRWRPTREAFGIGNSGWNLKRLIPLSPFIYIGLGVLFGWWAWAWVIIPMAPILFSGFSWKKFPAIAPFVYVLMGFWFGWWAWGWIIIPVSAILFGRGAFVSTGKRGARKRCKSACRDADERDDDRRN